jgi:hypothetical protein
VFSPMAIHACGAIILQPLDESQGSTEGLRAEQGLPMFLPLQVIIILLLVAFFFGYGVRACISRRRL